MVATTALTNVGMTAWATQYIGTGKRIDVDDSTAKAMPFNVWSDSVNSGRVWTDKSVYEATNVWVFGEDGAEQDVTIQDVGDADFIEVFSALGTSQVINQPTPVDIKTQKLNEGNDPTEQKLTVKDGDIVTYYITVTNSGKSAASDVAIYDRIPEGDPKLTLVDGSISDNGELQEDGVGIFWRIPTIGINESITVSFKVKIPDVNANTVWKNIAYVHYDPDDPNPKTPPEDPNDPDDPWNPTPEVEIEEKYPAVSVVKEQSSIRFGRTRDMFSAAGGDVVTYYLTVTNSGEETAEQVVITDQVPQKTVQTVQNKPIPKYRKRYKAQRGDAGAAVTSPARLSSGILPGPQHAGRSGSMYRAYRCRARS